MVLPIPRPARDHAWQPSAWPSSGEAPPSPADLHPVRAALAFALPGTAKTAWGMYRLLVVKTLLSAKAAYLWIFDKSLTTVHRKRRRNLARQRKDKEVLLADDGLFVKRRNYCKHYFLQPWRRLRPSKSRREFNLLSHMRDIGVPCPGNLAFREERNWLGLLNSGELSMERLDQAADIRHLCLLDEYAPIIQNPAFRQGLVAEVARWVKHMHEQQFFHLNLNFRNILVNTAPAFPVQVHFIDVTSAKTNPLPIRASYFRMKELAFLYKDARKWFTPREMVRFLHLYFGCRRLPRKTHRFTRLLVAYAQKKWGDRSSTL